MDRTLSERVKIARALAGDTREAAAAALELSQRHYGRLEGGSISGSLTVSQLARIASYVSTHQAPLTLEDAARAALEEHHHHHAT